MQSIVCWTSDGRTRSARVAAKISPIRANPFRARMPATSKKSAAVSRAWPGDGYEAPASAVGRPRPGCSNRRTFGTRPARAFTSRLTGCTAGRPHTRGEPGGLTCLSHNSTEPMATMSEGLHFHPSVRPSEWQELKFR